MTVGEALALARAAGLARLDARLLLARALGWPPARVVAHDEATIDAAAEAAFRHDVVRRADGVPLAQLVGAKEFFGLDFEVTADVLVPRPETELLVEWGLEVLGRSPADVPPAVVDLGTGSGAIAVALAVSAVQRGRTVRVIAVDASDAALAVARRNAARHGVRLDARRGDWWQPLVGERVGLALANPPYIAAGDPHLASLRHEPDEALIGGADGLRDLATIVGSAPDHLLAGAWLLLEHGRDQGPAVRSLLAAAGFDGIATRLDLAGHERATGGRRR